MEHELKIKYTRFITMLAAIVVPILIVVNLLNSEDNIFLFYNVPGLVLVLIVLAISYIFPQKRWVPSLIPSFLLLFYITTGEIAMSNGNRLPTGGIILFPVYTFFLMGQKYGLIITTLFGVWAIGSPFIHNLTPAVYGMNINSEFPFLYMLTVIICFGLEVIRSTLLSHLRFLSVHDDLTKLLNRQGFSDSVETTLSPKRPLYLMLLDLNNFTNLNRNLGNNRCNEILAKVAELFLQQEFEHVGRWYGDQFVLTYCGTKDALIEILNSMQEQMKEIPHTIHLDFTLSFKCGIAHFPIDGADFEELMLHANSALKHNTIHNDSIYHFYSEEDTQRLLREEAIDRDLLTAVKEKTLEVWFQPKISPDTGRVTGMEALSRWTHPVHGYIAPPEFISSAERNGTIHTLGDYVIDEALRHLKRCHSQGYYDLTISINISPLHLMQNDFFRTLAESCKRHRIIPTFIYLEMTESVLVQEEVKELLETIQSVGFNLSLDDFGTGYSSLSYLSNFHFDELKIDKSFTDKLLTSSRDKDLFSFIVKIAKRLSMKTVVEGLEDKMQMEMVQAMEIDEIQGWYYSKALTGDDFMVYLEKLNQ